MNQVIQKTCTPFSHTFVAWGFLLRNMNFNEFYYEVSLRTLFLQSSIQKIIGYDCNYDNMFKVEIS